MVLGMRIGGLAAAAVSAWLTLQPGPPVVQSPPHVAQESVVQSPPHVAQQSVVQSQEAVEPSLVYRSPVEAEVIDPFRPPAHVGAPGNRGLEYDPEPGLPVRASAEGEVVFAGSVVNNRFVTVLHRDGLRTSYGYLGWIAVEEGDWVALGQQLGTTSERFFFSIRHGDRYLDPALVLTAGRVRLVPHLEPRGRSRLPAYG